MPQRPDKGPVPGDKKWDPVKGRYPVPPPESVSVTWVARFAHADDFASCFYVFAASSLLFARCAFRMVYQIFFKTFIMAGQPTPP